MNKVVYKKEELELNGMIRAYREAEKPKPCTFVHAVKAYDREIEITYTDGLGHFWFEKYTESEYKDRLNRGKL